MFLSTKTGGSYVTIGKEVLSMASNDKTAAFITIDSALLCNLLTPIRCQLEARDPSGEVVDDAILAVQQIVQMIDDAREQKRKNGHVK